MRFRVWLPAMLVITLACSETPVPAQAPAAGALTQRLGCLACHSLHGQGNTRGSSLDGVDARRSRGELDTILNQPRRILPHVKMPSYAYLPSGEIQSLVDFLTRRH